MLKSTYSYSNQKNTNHVCPLPLDACSVSDMVRVNLFTKLDDCKVNKSKLIYDKCGKDLKCKIDDKTMNELKKGLKCEIDDKTKNELKEQIKNELEKSLKFKIGDETKNKLKEDIKNELQKGLKFEIDDKTKNELKYEVKKGIMNEVDWCRMMDSCDSDKSIGSGLITEKNIQVNCPDYATRYKLYNNIDKPGWSTADLLSKFFPDLMSNKKITSHFYTKDVKQYHAENFKITFKCEEDSKCSSKIHWTWASPSNMWCSNGPQDQEKVTCNSTPYPYFAYEYSKNFFLNNKCPNLVLNLKKEELAECAGKTIVAKLEAPLIITDYFNKIIDKDGNNTEINYYLLKSFLNKDGTTIEECGGNEMCQKYAKILDKILWTSDKEIKLTIPDTGNQMEKSEEIDTGSDAETTTSDDGTTTSNDLSYSEGMAFPHYGYGNDLI